MMSKVDAVEFAAAVKKVSGILMKSSIPQLEQVRVQFADDACRVSATNLSMWLSSDIAAEGEQFSFVFRNTKKLLRVLRHYQGELTMEMFGKEDDLKVLLRCGGKAGEFPVLEDDWLDGAPAVYPLRHYDIKTDELYHRAANVAYATAIRENRPCAAGVRFCDSRLWCVDGYRMAIHQDAALDVKTPFVLPYAALKHLKVFGEQDGKLYIGEKYAAIRTDGMELTCRLIEDDGMTIEAVMPRNSKEAFSINRRQFLKALDYLTDCVQSKDIIKVVFDQGRLLVDQKHNKYAASVDVLGGKSEVVFAFNLRYMREAVEQFKDTEEVQISTSSAISPIILSAGGAETAMVLPVRMTDSAHGARAA